MKKCLVFDLDDTLWLPKQTASFNHQRADALRLFLIYLRHNGYFLAVASFNVEAQGTVDWLFPNTFHLVVQAQHPDDALSHNKLPMLQIVRKAYRRHMGSVGYRTKLRWTEMVLFDDSDGVIQRIKTERPTLTVCEVNSKTGVTKRTISDVLERLHGPSIYL